MKKRILSLALCAMLLLALCLPGAAYSEYGAIYDGTDELWSSDLEALGTETLPAFTNDTGIDLRVDILDYSDYDSIYDHAADIYYDYDYGCGDDKVGVTLTLVLDSDGSGYYLADDSKWCVYASGDDRLADKTHEIEGALTYYLSQSSWEGGLEEDCTVLTEAVSQFYYTVSDIAYDLGYFDGGEASGEPDSTAAVSTASHVYDYAVILSPTESAQLEEAAARVSDSYECGVYIATVNSYSDYDPAGAYEAAYGIYHELSLGYGPGRDGIILLLSMNDRKFATFSYGEKSEAVFTDSVLRSMEDEFLDNFADDDWYGGFADYVSACESSLSDTDDSSDYYGYDDYSDMPFSLKLQASLGVMGTMFIVGAVIAACCVLVMFLRMKTTRRGTTAEAYVAAGSFELDGSYDNYTHTTTTRTKIERDNDSGGSSGSESGGGGHGRSGSF